MTGTIGDDGVALRYSRGKLFLYAIGGLAFAAAAIWIVVEHLAPSGSYKEVVIWAGIPFFLLIAGLALRRMFETGVVVEIGRRGIRDTRISPEWIPWPAIVQMRVQEIRRRKLISFDLDPAFERSIPIGKSAAFSRQANSAFGISGHVLNVAGLDASFADVLAAIERYGRRI